MPYHDIPSLKTFQSDSSIFLALRSSDKTLVEIDNLVALYATAIPQQPDVLYYLYLATKFWLKKNQQRPNNQHPAGFNPRTGALPQTPKVEGEEGRRNAISELYTIARTKLIALHQVRNEEELGISLADTYGARNHEIQNDTAWMEKYGLDPTVTVYLTDDGDRRRYKLRFRSNLAWRWQDANQSQGGYVPFDSTDNSESETNDQLIHFVMDRRGRIYMGFEKDVIWFKHSSLVGGDAVLSAGRMKAEQGKITHVENDSGHYQPTAKHMINILRRLAIYGQSLGSTTVRRMSDKKTFTAINVLNAVSTWPDGQAGW
jgi:hypothetical protein